MAKINKADTSGMQNERGTWARDLTASAMIPMVMRPKQFAKLIIDTCAACQADDSVSS